MVQKAKFTPTATERLMQLMHSNSQTYALNRLSKTVALVGNAPLGNLGSSAGGVQASQANYLKVQGDTMVGPIAFYPSTVSVNASDELDISPSQTSTPKASSRVIASFSSPDKIQLIKGAQFAGQLLFLQVPASSVLTLEDYSNNAGGNIVTSTQSDFVVTTSTDPKIVMLQFDVTVSPNSNNGGWVVISSMSADGLTEPLLQTVTAVTTATEPTTTDIDCSLGNVFTITVDEDITMDFTNETASKYQLIHIIFTQDGTGGHTVTWPSTVKKTPLDSSQPVVSETASNQTDVILYTTDQGTNWYWTVASQGAASSFSGNLSDLTIDTDFDANGVYKYILDADADTYLIGDTDDRIEFFTANTEKVRIDTNLQLQGGVDLDANGNDIILDVDDDTYIHSSGDDNFELFVGAGARLTCNTGTFAVKSGVILNVEDHAIFDIISTPASTANMMIYGLNDTQDALVLNVTSGSEVKIDEAGTELFTFSNALMEFKSTTVNDIQFIRDDATPNDGDAMGRLRFLGDDSGGTQKEFSAVKGVQLDVTSTSADGEVVFDILVDNQLTEMFRFGPEGTGTTTPTLEIFEDDASPANGALGNIFFHGS